MQLRRAPTLAAIPPQVLLSFEATPSYAASSLVADFRPAGAPPLRLTTGRILWEARSPRTLVLPAALKPPPPPLKSLTPPRPLSSLPGRLNPRELRPTSRYYRGGSCSAVVRGGGEGSGSVARAVAALRAARWQGGVAPAAVVPEGLAVAAAWPRPPSTTESPLPTSTPRRPSRR